MNELANEDNLKDSEKAYEIEILMIADRSMFEAFLEIYRGDDFAAYHGLSDYLNGIFDQVYCF